MGIFVSAEIRKVTEIRFWSILTSIYVSEPHFCLLINIRHTPEPLQTEIYFYTTDLQGYSHRVQ